MIKRRFYRADRGDKDGSSDSSSDSEVEARGSDDSGNELQNLEPIPKTKPGSKVKADNDDEDSDDDDDKGYDSEDSSANEIDVVSGGLLANDDDSGSGKDGDRHKESLFPRKENGEITETQTKDHTAADDLPKCVLKIKSAFKCRLCPKIVCLNEETLKGHLKSKRHSRSEKLLNEGRLKRVLNSDGEEEVLSEDDGETHAERHARIIAMAQDTSTKKTSKGRQRQKKRSKRKGNSSKISNSGQQKENRAKRRRKIAD